MSRFVLFTALIALGTALFGCKVTPCKQFQDANWVCNLSVVDAVEPGDLIYLSNDGVSKVTLPDSIDGFSVDVRPTNVADQTGKQDWTFGLDAGLAGIPGIGSIEAPKAKLEAAGFKEIEFSFTDSTIHSLKSQGGSGVGTIEQAKILADRYIDAMTPMNRSATGQGPNDGKVWLVMQTLNSNVSGRFVRGGSVGVDAGAVVQGVAASINGATANTMTDTITIDDPLPIAYRAIPLAITRPGGASLQAPPEIAVVPDSDWSGPRR